MLAVLVNETSAIIQFRLTQFLCYISPEERVAVEVKIVVEVAKLANAEITKDQISTFHRLAAKPERNAIDQAAQSTPPILVRFISRDIRNQLYANRQNLRNANLKHFSTDGTNHFYINENLTRYRKKLFWNIKARAKSHHFKYYWTSNGNIFVKKSEESQPLLIKSDEDLALIE